MNTRIGDMRDKQVLNVQDGSLVGFVEDLEFDCEQGRITALIVHCKSRGFFAFAKEEELFVKWEDIAVIGEDSVLIRFEKMKQPTPREKENPHRYFMGK